MIKEILFGVVDNGILILGGVLGFNLEKQINEAFKIIVAPPYILKTRIKGLSATILGAGIANGISDWFGGLCISSEMAFGSFFGCVGIVILCFPVIFKLEKI